MLSSNNSGPEAYYVDILYRKIGLQNLSNGQPGLWALLNHKNASCGLMNPVFGSAEQLQSLLSALHTTQWN